VDGKRGSESPGIRGSSRGARVGVAGSKVPGNSSAVTIGGTPMSETAMSETAVPAVPAMIHRILFRPVTTIAPGERIDSAEIDVGGAQHVTVNLGIKGPARTSRS
jgi:hypothetical protein